MSGTAKFFLWVGVAAAVFAAWHYRARLLKPYRDYQQRQREARSQLLQKPVTEWSQAERLANRREYAELRAAALPQLPCVQWTGEEKEAHQKLFLTKFRQEIETAVQKLEADIRHWEKEEARCAALANRETEAAEKAEALLRQGVPLLKAKSFPVTLQGVAFSRAELAQLLVSYQDLRKRSKRHAQEYCDLQQAAGEQLTLKRRELTARQAESESSRMFLARLEAKERIGSMQQVMAEISQGLAAAQTISQGAAPVLEQEHAKVAGQRALDQDTLSSLQEEFK